MRLFGTVGVFVLAPCTGTPHLGQTTALSSISFPQFVQNMYLLSFLVLCQYLSIAFYIGAGQNQNEVDERPYAADDAT